MVLLSGWSGAGKDAVASLLVQRAGYVRLAFADVLKDIVTAELGVSRALADDPCGKQMTCTLDGVTATLREWLINRALDLRASGGPSIFADVVARAISAAPAYAKFVVSDWRLPDVREFLLKGLPPDQQVTTVRVQRAGMVCSPVTHAPTENALDAYAFDVTIHNPGTDLEALWAVVEPALRP